MPREFIPAVKKGVDEALLDGVLAGYPVVNVKVTLFDGSYHEVDSNENAFKMAAIFAFKDGMRAPAPVLLEPIMAVEVETPAEFDGRRDRRPVVAARRDARAWRIVAGSKVIKAEVPLARDVRLLDHDALAVRRAALPTPWNSNSTPRRRRALPRR